MADKKPKREESKGDSSKVTFNIDKAKNFPDWYDRAIEVAQMVDTRYPLKGMNAWMPYGFKALKLMMRQMEMLLDAKDHHEVYFPMLVPESIFGKESEFLKGFSGESFVVTHAGKNPLTEKLYIRPTSETVMYSMVREWIRSFADLPLKLYQTVNVFRYETRMTRPMLRVREVVKFKEAHTFHATSKDADSQIKEGIEIYSEFFDMLMIPYLVVKTLPWDTFAGAEYNFDFMSVIPDGKGIELASVINLGTKFAKAYDLKYETEKGDHEYVHQTCYGISERELGVVMAIHGDNKGLILPPLIAPIQIVIVPIYFAGREDPVRKMCNEVLGKLTKLGFRVEFDDSGKTPGEKYYKWEARGVPVRIEIGPRDVEAGKAVSVRRDTGAKASVPVAELEKSIRLAFEEINKTLKENGQRYFSARVLHFATTKEVKEKYTERLGMLGLPWCGDQGCAKKLEKDIDIPTIGFKPYEGKGQKCASCGKTAGVTELFFGRTY